MFTSRTARSLGYSERQVRYRLAHHRWYRVVGHALSVDPPPPSGWSPVTLARAASITWPEAVVGFRVAAAVLGFPVRRETTVHVLTPAKRHPLHGVVPHFCPVGEEETWIGYGGVRFTRPGRTALDCLAVLPPAEADDLHAWLVTRRYLSPQSLEAGIRDRRRRLGTGRLRDLQHRSASGVLSEAERRVHRLLRETGVTGWEANVRLEDADGIIGVVDILFREERVVVEIDGRRAHDTEDSFVRDRRRQNRLVNAGYRVLRFTWADIVSRPQGILTEIRTALARSVGWIRHNNVGFSRRNEFDGRGA
ncbi:MAG: hypothetical protein QG622_3044 [Actinomycetota bacterium]|nr:hypothetical protein [Actinomycetota bacterium]